METVLEYLSSNIKLEIQKYMKNCNDNIEEIRLRNNRPVVIRTGLKNMILEHIVTTEELLETFQNVCEHSIYSYQKQICEGFITIKGGHRVGITGNCAIENGKIININYISSLNFRIAKERKGCSNKILNYIIDNGEILNTLIISRPGCGKTTMLRDLVRNISSGVSQYNLTPKTCGVVDERGEIASMYKGIPQNDVGILSDVIDNVSKSDGMKMLVRSMSPDVIICDEIGSYEDMEAIEYAMCSGVKGIFTAHGNNLVDLLNNNEIRNLMDKKIIELIIILDEKMLGEVKNIYKLDKENKSYIKIV